MTLGRDRPTANQKTHLSFLIRDPEENAHRAGKIKKVAVNVKKLALD